MKTMPKTAVRRRALLLLGALFLAPACDVPVGEIGLPAAGGGLPVRIPLVAQADPAGVRITLDGADVTSFFTAGAGAMTGVLPLPTPGPHRLDVDQPWLSVAGFPLH